MSAASPPHDTFEFWREPANMYVLSKKNGSRIESGSVQSKSLKGMACRSMCVCVCVQEIYNVTDILQMQTST